MLLFVEDEQKLLDFRIAHPNLWGKNKLLKQELYWGDKFVKRCLIELIMALFFIGAINDKFGKPVAFKPLVQGFETLFDIDLSLAYDERRKIMHRTKKTSFFLDMLREKLLEKIVAKKD